MSFKQEEGLNLKADGLGKAPLLYEGVLACAGVTEFEDYASSASPAVFAFSADAHRPCPRRASLVLHGVSVQRRLSRCLLRSVWLLCVSAVLLGSLSAALLVMCRRILWCWFPRCVFCRVARHCGVDAWLPPCSSGLCALPCLAGTDTDSENRGMLHAEKGCTVQVLKRLSEELATLVHRVFLLTFRSLTPLANGEVLGVTGAGLPEMLPLLGVPITVMTLLWHLCILKGLWAPLLHCGSDRWAWPPGDAPVVLVVVWLLKLVQEPLPAPGLTTSRPSRVLVLHPPSSVHG